MSIDPNRKGARSRADVSPVIVEALSRGEISAQNLVEAMTVDFDRMVREALNLDSRELSLMNLPYTHRIQTAAQLLYEQRGEEGIAICLSSQSDTVRGIGAYAIRLHHGESSSELVAAIRPLAADPHFAVREWAWLAIRPEIVARPIEFFELLTPWASDIDPFIRRFASEATRPRGVWCAHVKELVRNPERAIKLLEPLRADPEKYVQDSVANWLNDAAKSRSEWVLETCQRWLEQSDCPATKRIVQRGCRSLRT